MRVLIMGLKGDLARVSAMFGALPADVTTISDENDVDQPPNAVEHIIYLVSKDGLSSSSLLALFAGIRNDVNTKHSIVVKLEPCDPEGASHFYHGMKMAGVDRLREIIAKH